MSQDTMKHTPGPWEVKEIQGQIFVAGKPYEGHPYFNRTTTVEIMSDEDYPTKEADAHFIAAAPDMLEALKLCKRLIDEALPKFNWAKSALDANAIQLLNEVPKTVNNAIQKAEGR